MLSKYEELARDSARQWIEPGEPAVEAALLDLGNGPCWYRILDGIPNADRACVELLAFARALREAVAKDDHELATVTAISLGRAIERAHIAAAFEPLVKSEKGRRKGARKTAVEILNADHVEQQSRYQPEVERLMLEENISYSAACLKAAAGFGVTERTIRTYTHNPAPRNRGRKVGKR